MTFPDTAREYFTARIAMAQTREDRYLIRQDVAQLQLVADMVLNQLEAPYHEALLQEQTGLPTWCRCGHSQVLHQPACSVCACDEFHSEVKASDETRSAE